MKKLSYQSTLGEEIFSSITHGIGALLSIAAMILLIIHANTPLQLFSALIFGISATVLYTMSTLFHSFPKGTVRRVFQRFDHLSIYILIAGSYTPFCLLILDKRIGIPLFFLQWGLALIGIVFKSIWIKKFNLVHVAIFLLMGWSVIFFMNNLYQNIQTAGFIYLLLGGVSYSIGVFFYIFRIFKFHHAIWHFFVMFGTILHFFSIYFYVFK